MFAPSVSTTPTPIVPGVGNNSPSNAIGIDAPSLAQINANQPYKVRSVILGVNADTRDDIQNPRRGSHASVSDEISTRSFGSDFNYQLVTLDLARFFPVGKKMTLGLHGRAGASTGAIPTNKLFIFSDQDLRGYSNPFYGTDILLGQVELRFPLTADRKFAVVAFGDSGATRIRGGSSQIGNELINLNPYVFHGDVGLGLRFDVPQLGLRTLRLDFAKGAQGTHTSFGIGQSF